MSHHDVSSPQLPPSSPATRQTPVKSASRVLDVIEWLAAAPDGLVFSDLARHLSLPKSSLHGLLMVLTERGYVAFDPERRTYSLGIRVWEAG
ncbi:MAG TPA: helix-turn-helix domain-containing protein, partial [Thermomicrobiales bacterium]|nr:helix-turn-helix domain-containing protein [Thermomicrobiales bacterium]